jgi:hypothetical protein
MYHASYTHLKTMLLRLGSYGLLQLSNMRGELQGSTGNVLGMKGRLCLLPSDSNNVYAVSTFIQ